MLKPNLRIYKYQLFVPILCALLTSTVAASEFWENWDLSVSAGYGERSNPLLNAEDIKTYINIDIAWYGDRFFFDNGDIGYNLIFSDSLSLNLVGQLNNERVFFGKTNTDYISIGNPALDSGAPIGGADEKILVEYEVADRNHAYEAGIEAIFEGSWGQLHAAVLSDVTNQHNGERADLTYSFNHIWRRWLIQPSVGFSWKSAALTDYYFGVTPTESRGIVPVYEAEAGINSFGRLLVNYAINKDLFWGVALEYERLGDAIADSPIVLENRVVTAYTGIKYRF